MKELRNRKWVRIAVVISFIVMLAANVLAVYLPMGGSTPRQLSDLYPNLFTPAPLTFMIWILIYVLYGIHVLYQLGAIRVDIEESLYPGVTPRTLPDGTPLYPQRNKLLNAAGVGFTWANLLNAAWIIAWHYRYVGLSVVIMIALLTVLTWTLHVIDVNPSARKDRISLMMPFAVSMAWICAALIANVSAFLVYRGYDGKPLTPVIWTVIVIALAALIGSVATIRFQAAEIGAVFLWAFAGIAIRQLNSVPGNLRIESATNPPILIAALVGAIVVAAVSVVALFSKAPRHGAWNPVPPSEPPNAAISGQ